MHLFIFTVCKKSQGNLLRYGHLQIDEVIASISIRLSHMDHVRCHRASRLPTVAPSGRLQSCSISASPAGISRPLDTSSGTRHPRMGKCIESLASFICTPPHTLQGFYLKKENNPSCQHFKRERTYFYKTLLQILEIRVKAELLNHGLKKMSLLFPVAGKQISSSCNPAADQWHLS